MRIKIFLLSLLVATNLFAATSITVDRNGNVISGNANFPTGNLKIGGVSVTTGGGGAGLSDGDKGEVTITSGVWTIDSGAVAYSELTGIPVTFTPNVHLHSLADVTGLTAALAAKQALLPIGGVATQYLRGDYTLATFPTIPTNNNQLTNGSGFITGITSSNVTTALGFTPGTSSFSGAYGALSGIPATFAPTAHVHGEGDVTGLLTSLAGKQASLPTGGTTLQYLTGNYTLATFPTNLSAFTNGPGYITGITSGNVTTALGYTPGTSNFSGVYNTLSGIPSTFTPAAHVHVTADVAGLDTTISGLQSKTGVLAIAGFSSVTGIIPYANLPTGTVAGTVAIGNHNHNLLYQPLASNLTSFAALTGTGLFYRTGSGGISSVTMGANMSFDATTGSLSSSAGGAAVGGSGDMFGSNNLSELTNVATARTKLALGSAALSNTTDFATAAQGTTANSALQATSINTVGGVQGYDANNTILGNVTTGTGSIVRATSPILTGPSIGVATGTSLALSGSLTANNFSGSNTGDQVVPPATPVVITNFLTGYTITAGVGSFTKAQPKFTDMIATGIGSIATFEQMPTGTTATTVAIGNHNHSLLYQPVNSNLTSFSGLTSAGLFYRNGSGNIAGVSMGGNMAFDVTTGVLSANSNTGMLGSNNLSELTDVSAARTKLALGSAALSNVGDFASTAQGAKADSAIQTAAINAVGGVQGYNSNTTILGNTTTGTGAIARDTSPTLITPNLGAATGATLSLSGAITASNLSGTNTGNQVVPLNTLVAANQFFTAYNSATGAFTRAQPLFSDLSGIAAIGQLPTGVTAATVALGNHLHAGVYQPSGSYATGAQGATADTALQPAAIGVSVQGYSTNTTLLGNTTSGTGSIVRATSPTLIAPDIGVASGTSLTLSGTMSASNFSGSNTGDQTVPPATATVTSNFLTGYTITAGVGAFTKAQPKFTDIISTGVGSVATLAQIPTGSTATTVAIGNHGHADSTSLASGFMSTIQFDNLAKVVTDEQLISTSGINITWGTSSVLKQGVAITNATETVTMPAANSRLKGQIITFLDNVTASTSATRGTQPFGRAFSPATGNTINGASTAITPFIAGGIDGATGTAEFESDGVSNWTRIYSGTQIVEGRDSLDLTKTFYFSSLPQPSNTRAKITIAGDGVVVRPNAVQSSLIQRKFVMEIDGSANSNQDYIKESDISVDQIPLIDASVEIDTLANYGSGSISSIKLTQSLTATRDYVFPNVANYTQGRIVRFVSSVDSLGKIARVKSSYAYGGTGNTFNGKPSIDITRPYFSTAFVADPVNNNWIVSGDTGEVGKSLFNPPSSVVGSTVTLTCSSAPVFENHHSVTMSGSITLAFNGCSAGDTGLIQFIDSAGGSTVTLPAGIGESPNATPLGTFVTSTGGPVKDTYGWYFDGTYYDVYPLAKKLTRSSPAYTTPVNADSVQGVSGGLFQIAQSAGSNKYYATRVTVTGAAAGYRIGKVGLQLSRPATPSGGTNPLTTFRVALFSDDGTIKPMSINSNGQLATSSAITYASIPTTLSEVFFDTNYLVTPGTYWIVLYLDSPSKTISDAATTVSSTTVTSASNGFLASDVGSTISSSGNITSGSYIVSVASGGGSATISTATPATGVSATPFAATVGVGNATAFPSWSYFNEASGSTTNYTYNSSAAVVWSPAGGSLALTRHGRYTVYTSP